MMAPLCTAAGLAGGLAVTTGLFVKASASTNPNGCVEVAPDGDGYLIRDSKDVGRGPVLAVSPDDWARLEALLLDGAGGLQTRELDGLEVERRPCGGISLGDHSGHRLDFDAHEVQCFADGLRRGEFTAARWA